MPHNAQKLALLYIISLNNEEKKAVNTHKRQDCSCESLYQLGEDICTFLFPLKESVRICNHLIWMQSLKMNISYTLSMDIKKALKKALVHISDDSILAECFGCNAISLQSGSLPGVHLPH